MIERHSTRRGSVLVGFGESIAGPEAVWSLRDAGFEVIVFTRRSSRAAARRCQGVKVCEVTAPEKDVNAAREDLLSAALRWQPVAALPLDDSSLWLLNSLRNQIPCALAMAPLAGVEVALDKGRQLESARLAGLLVPGTVVATCVSEVVSSSLRYPIVMKPALAIRRQNGLLARARTYFCNCDQDLTQAFGSQTFQERFLVQSLISGCGEGLFGFMKDSGQVCAWSAHKRVRMMNPQGSGSSACKNLEVDSALLDKVQQMLSLIGWRGIFMVEILRDEAGCPWFMELNGRAWGSTALARRMGFEYPAWAVEQALDSDFVPPIVSPKREMLARHLGRELVRVLFVLRGQRGPAAQSWPRTLDALRDALLVHKGDVFYNYRRGERRVFISDTVGTILGYVLPRRFR